MRRTLPTLVFATVWLMSIASLGHGEVVVVPTTLEALRDEYLARQAARASGAPARASALGADDSVAVDAVASGDADALAADLAGIGMENVSVFGRIVSGRLPLSAVDALSGLPGLAFARPALATTNVGLVTSQGDPSMLSDVARTTFGVDGTGLTVGALSDSFDCLGGAAADVVSNDLSAVNVLQDEPGCGSGSDEGRGMLQLVHDVAPGAALAFATAFTGQAGFASNILALQAAGADVIVDDVFYFAEPMFQDGIIAQAVDNVVAANVPYFSSAGNQASNGYSVAFNNSGTDLGPAGTNQIALGGLVFVAHDFDPGAGVDLFQTVTFPGGQTCISLQWADPFFSVSGAPGAATDLDFALFNLGGTFLGGSFDSNVGADPVEVICVNGPGSAQLAIGNFAGPDPDPIKYVAFRSTFVVNEFATSSGTIFGHANAIGAEATGAAAFFNTPAFGVTPPLLNGFSSRGTTPILFDTAGNPTFDARADKPEITAPDGTNTTFFGSDIVQDADAFPNFFGTSAAAPHAAAVAALMLQASPGASPTAVYSSLESTAIDMDAPGFDNDSGFGLIQADAAIADLACGDGVVLQGEGCDDGGTTGGDGCSATCTVEPGYACTGQPSVCTPICGDSVIIAPETCDDGNVLDGDCCSSTCQLQDCTLAVAKDAFLRKQPHNTNEGGNTLLTIRNKKNRTLVGFDLTGKNLAALNGAKLVFTVKKNLRGWRSGKDVDAHALLEDFAEGNGQLLGSPAPTRGTGPGVTSECATDTDIANVVTDCAVNWNGGNFAAAATDSVTHTNATAGAVTYDVTADVQAGVEGWLLKRAIEKGSGGVNYYSREGAAAAGDPTLAPRLELDY